MRHDCMPTRDSAGCSLEDDVIKNAPMPKTDDELFEMLRNAYLRGAAWVIVNDMDSVRYLQRAAHDYADSTISEMKRNSQ